MSELQKYRHLEGYAWDCGADLGSMDPEPPEGALFYLVSEVDTRLALMQRCIDWLLETGVVIDDGWPHLAREWDEAPVLVPTDFLPFIGPSSEA